MSRGGHCVLLHVWIFTGSSCHVEVHDSVNAGHRDMSLKDWTTYYDNNDRNGFLTMSVELSRTKLEKCIELPEIVIYLLCFFVGNIFFTSG